MSDAVTFSVDTAPIVAALRRLGDTALKYTKPASKITALNIQREARDRLERQTKHGTGRTAENTLVTESYDGTGYVVHTTDSRLDAGQLIPGKNGKHRIAPSFFQEKHVGLWLEKGTVHMAARPWFYPSANLEEGAHERRIADAIEQAIAEEGLGE